MYQTGGLHSSCCVDGITKETIARHFASDYTGYRSSCVETDPDLDGHPTAGHQTIDFISKSQCHYNATYDLKKILYKLYWMNILPNATSLVWVTFLSGAPPTTI